MSLTKTDLSQIRKVIKEEVKPVRSDIESVKEDVETIDARLESVESDVKFNRLRLSLVERDSKTLRSSVRKLDQTAKSIKKDTKKIRDDFEMGVGVLDRDQVKVKSRVERIENFLKIPPLST